MKNEKSVTLDDHHVELVANIGSPKDIQGVLDNGGEGVGLFRTEFLYMESAELPTPSPPFSLTPAKSFAEPMLATNST